MKFVCLVVAAILMLLKGFGFEGAGHIDFGWLGVAAFASYFLWKESEEDKKK